MNTSTRQPGTTRKITRTLPDGQQRFHFAITYACGHEEETNAPVHLNPVFAEKAKTQECLKCLNKKAR